MNHQYRRAHEHKTMNKSEHSTKVPAVTTKVYAPCRCNKAGNYSPQQNIQFIHYIVHPLNVLIETVMRIRRCYIYLYKLGGWYQIITDVLYMREIYICRFGQTILILMSQRQFSKNFWEFIIQSTQHFCACLELCREPKLSQSCKTFNF